MKNFKTTMFSLLIATVMVGCAAKESTYKAAYELAQQKELADASVNEVKTEQESVVAEPATKPEAPQVVKVEPTVKVTTEKVTTVDANDAPKLKKYNVIVGTFSITTNANSLKNRLIGDGYNAFTVQNSQGWYRVVAASFDTREEATSSREAIKQRYAGQFNDAWLLINE